MDAFVAVGAVVDGVETPLREAGVAEEAPLGEDGSDALPEADARVAEGTSSDLSFFDGKVALGMIPSAFFLLASAATVAPSESALLLGLSLLLNMLGLLLFCLSCVTFLCCLVVHTNKQTNTVHKKLRVGL